MSLDRVESISKILGVAVACFGVYTYFQALEQDTVNRSLSYYDEFHSGRVFEARIWVGQASYRWTNYRNTDGSKLTSTEIQAVMVSELSTEPGVIHYDLINEFFLRAKKCIDVGGCHKDTLVDLLSEDAQHLFVFFLPKVFERSQLGDDSALGLACFSDGFVRSQCSPLVSSGGRRHVRR